MNRNTFPPPERPYQAAWKPGGSYHAYNRAVALNRLFVEPQDYQRFRWKLQRLAPYLELFAFGSAVNHFHLHFRVYSLDVIQANLRQEASGLTVVEHKFLDGRVTFQQLIGSAFGRAFHAYTKSFNLAYQRQGDLFNHTVRRRRVRNDLLSRRLCAYLHCQELKHGIGGTVCGVGRRTSFQEILDGDDSFVHSAAVLQRFGGRANFLAYHRAYAEQKRQVLQRFDERRYFGCAASAPAKPVWAL